MKILPRFPYHGDEGHQNPAWLRWGWRLLGPVYRWLAWTAFVYDGPEGMMWDEGHFCFPWNSSRKKFMTELSSP